MSKTDLLETAWSRLDLSFSNHRLGHAQLFCSGNDILLESLVMRFAGWLFCQAAVKPCLQCQSCQLIALKTHPDINLIQPEKQGSPIKIDQIRSLQSLIYTSPQLSDARLVIIKSAERMNQAAANALLKMLEEPPSGVYFILLVNQISTIPATVLSRCQIRHFSFDQANTIDYLTNGYHEAMNEAAAKIMSDQTQLIQELDALLNHHYSVCSLALKWSAYDLQALLSVLYRLHAQMIYLTLVNQSGANNPVSPLLSLAKRIKLPQLFIQIDKINAISKKLNHTVSVNQLLALESLLLGYRGE